MQEKFKIHPQFGMVYSDRNVVVLLQNTGVPV